MRITPCVRMMCLSYPVRLQGIACCLLPLLHHDALSLCRTNSFVTTELVSLHVSYHRMNQHRHGVCVSSHKTVLLTRRHPAHPVSALILHPKETQVLWSQSYDTGSAGAGCHRFLFSFSFSSPPADGQK